MQVEANSFDLSLPPIRNDLEEAKADLETFGVARLAGAVSAAAMAAARTRLLEQAAGEAEAGVAHLDDGHSAYPMEAAANQRVWNLLNKGAIFHEFALNPVADALVRHMLGENFLLFSLTANIARLGGAPQKLHGDQQFAPAETPYPLLANSLWMLDDFTDENGATRVVPTSHLAKRWPDLNEPIVTIPATGPAGTLMVWDGRLWHGTGANRTDKPRHGLISAYCRPFLRQQENHMVSIAPEVIEQSSPELLELIGFTPWLGLGMIDGKLSQAQSRRPETFSSPMRPRSAT